MAIDSAAKRKSISSIGVRGRFKGRGVTPDATQPQAWRQTVGFGYFGILAGAGAPVVVAEDANTRLVVGLRLFYGVGGDWNTLVDRIVIEIRNGTVVYTGLDTANTTAILKRLQADVDVDGTIDPA